MVDGKEIAKSKAEERRQKLVEIRRSRRKQLSVAIVVLLIALVGAHQLYKSGLFSVKRIAVSGNKFVSSAKVKETCDISENSNLLSIPTDEIRKELLRDPWIKDVTIKRRPLGTLIIEIKERTPVALVSHGGKFYLIDGDYFIIAERQYADSMGVPTITDLAIEKVKVGERVVNDSLVNAVECLRSMDPSLKKMVNLLAAESVDRLSLYLSLSGEDEDNVEILYGESRQAEKKNKVLEKILKEQGKQVILIDIRNFPQSDPVIKRIDPAPEN